MQANSTRATCMRYSRPSSKTVRLSSTRTTRSSKAHASRATAARSWEETLRDRRQPSRHAAHRVASRDLRRFRSHLQSADDVAHAADVRDQRDSRYRARRGDRRRGVAVRRRHLGRVDGRRNRSRHVRCDQRLRRIRRHRAHVADVSREGRREMSVAISLADLVAVACFILGLHFLNKPPTARLGNRLAAVGMLIALVAVLAQTPGIGWWAIALGIVIGGAIGIVAALRVKMTAMPQMVALYNGAGGGAAALISTLEYFISSQGATPLDAVVATSLVLSAIIGAVSFAGSIVAFLKLQEVMTG